MSWILTASVPGDDRVFTIGSKADYPEPGPWIARLASPILSLRAVFVTPGQPQCLSTGSSHIWCDIFHSPFACFLRTFRNVPLCDALVVLPFCTLVHATSSVPHT